MPSKRFFIVLLLAISFISVSIQKAEAKVYTCTWLSMWCKKYNTYESYCVNVGGNTQVGCPCGYVYPCDSY